VARAWPSKYQTLEETVYEVAGAETPFTELVFPALFILKVQ